MVWGQDKPVHRSLWVGRGSRDDRVMSASLKYRPNTSTLVETSFKLKNLDTTGLSQLVTV